MTEDNALYPEKYGAWQRPDYSRCCEEVSANGSWWGAQCSRKRGYGPHGAYCKQHDPEAVKARRDEAAAVYREKRRRRLIESYGPRFHAALKKIAAGADDPVSIAAEAIKGIEE